MGGLGNMSKIVNYLENQINKLITYINENDLGFGWENFCKRNFNGEYIQPEPFDFCIFTKKGQMVFDAKETDKEKWVILPKDKKQALNLFKCSKVGIEAFFLIYFITTSELMKIDINHFFDIMTTRKYIMQSDCVKFDYKELIKNGITSKNKK